MRTIRREIEKFSYRHPRVWREISKTIRFFRCADTAGCCRKLRFENNGKIRVAFIICMPEMWTSLQAVYENMLQDPRFEVFLIAQPKKLNNPADNEAFDFLSSKYPDVINAYSDSGEWLDPQQLRCEYTFYTRPYAEEYQESLKPSNTKKYSVTCYIPYGYSLCSGDIFDTVNNGSFLCECSIFFQCNESSWKINQERFGMAAKTNMIRLEFLGYPRFDLLDRHTYVPHRPDDEFCILWTPRFPTPDNGFNITGHFLDYYKHLIQFAEENTGIRIIIRPHPLMFERFRELRILTSEEIESIKQEIADADRVELDSYKDYRVSFSRSDLLITDLSSLIVEYYYSGKPVLYCDKADLFLEEAVKMDQTLYHCTDWQEMQQIVIDLKSGNDFRYSDRVRLIDEMAEVNNHSGSRIMEYIADDYARHIVGRKMR